MAISNRLKKRSKELKYWINSQDLAVSPRVVEVFIQGKSLQLHFDITSEGLIDEVQFFGILEAEKLAFIDILIDFIRGKDQKNLSTLSIREIENYCRDENHQEALSDQVFLEDVMKLLENVKNNVYNFSSLGTCFDFDPKLGEFKNYRLVDKIRILERLFDMKVRPALRKDGGNLVIENVEDGVIVVKFEGNCHSCPSSLDGTLSFVRQTIQSNLMDPTLRVITQV